MDYSIIDENSFLICIFSASIINNSRIIDAAM